MNEVMNIEVNSFALASISEEKIDAVASKTIKKSLKTMNKLADSVSRNWTGFNKSYKDYARTIVDIVNDSTFADEFKDGGQKQFAEFIGVSPSLITTYKNGIKVLDGVIETGENGQPIKILQDYDITKLSVMAAIPLAEITNFICDYGITPLTSQKELKECVKEWKDEHKAAIEKKDSADSKEETEEANSTVTVEHSTDVIDDKVRLNIPVTINGEKVLYKEIFVDENTAEEILNYLTIYVDAGKAVDNE